MKYLIMVKNCAVALAGTGTYILACIPKGEQTLCRGRKL